MTTGKKIRDFEQPASLSGRSPCEITPNNRFFLSLAGGDVRIWSTVTGKVFRHFKMGRAYVSRQLAISGNGKWLITPGTLGYQVVVLKTGVTRSIPKQKNEALVGMAFSPDSSRLVVSRVHGSNRTNDFAVFLDVYDTSGPTINTWRRIHVVRSPENAAKNFTFSGDGKKLIAAGEMRIGKLVVFNTDTWKTDKILTRSPNAFGIKRVYGYESLSFSKNGSHIATRPIYSGRPKVEVVSVAEGVFRQLGIEGNHRAEMTQFVNDEVIALAASSMPLRFYNVVTGKVVPPPKPDSSASPLLIDPIAKLPPEERLIAFRKAGRFEEAIKIGDPIVALAEKKNGTNNLRYLKLARALADSYRGMAKYPEAITVYQKCQLASESMLTVNDITFPPDLKNLARTHVLNAKPADALLLLTNAARSRSEKFSLKHLAVADVEFELGQFYWLMKQTMAARIHFANSLEIRKKEKRTPTKSLAASLMMTGQMFAEVKDFDKGLPLLQDAYSRLFNAKPVSYPELAESQMRMTLLYRDIGKEQVAAKFYSQCLFSVGKTTLQDNSLSLLYVLQQASRIQAELKLTNISEVTSRRSLDLAKLLYGPHDFMVTEFHSEMAHSYFFAKQYEIAAKYSQKAIDAFQLHFGDDYPRKAEMLLLQGRIYSRLSSNFKKNGVFKNDVDYISAAQRIADPSTTSGQRVRLEAGIQIGDYELRKGNYTAALDAFDNNVREMRKSLYRVLPILPDSFKSQFAQRSLRTLDAPLTALVDVHRATATGRTDAKTVQQWVDRSAEWMINTKGLTNEILAHQTVLLRNVKDGETKSILMKLAATRKKLSEIFSGGLKSRLFGPQRAKALKLYEEERALSAELGRKLRAQKLDKPWVTLAEIRKRLNPDSVLVEFTKFNHRDERERHIQWRLYKPKGWKPGLGIKFLPVPTGPYYAAWIIPAAGKGNVQFIPLGEGAKIDVAINQYYRQIQIAERDLGASSEDMDAATSQLSNLLLKVLHKPLAPYKRWILSPDGRLWLVPFVGLKTRRGEYLIEEHEIVSVTSSRSLLNKSGTSQKSKAAAIFANPDYNLGISAQPEVSPFPPLPGTATEAKAVAPLLAKYTGKEPQVFVLKKATEQQVKSLVSPRVMLLSTHGYFNLFSQRQNPLLRSGLAFAGANRLSTSGNQKSNALQGSADDGILTGLEVVSLNLTGTELVVLSACETGLGTVSRGGGIAGLRQAFHLAGSRSVVATLWTVPDRDTATLINEFFRQIAAGKRAGEALRLAQLKILHSQRANGSGVHPIDWAAFTISGISR
jgi:CHAT domain-containing protein